MSKVTKWSERNQEVEDNNENEFAERTSAESDGDGDVASNDKGDNHTLPEKEDSLYPQKPNTDPIVEKQRQKWEDEKKRKSSSRSPSPSSERLRQSASTLPLSTSMIVGGLATIIIAVIAIIWVYPSSGKDADASLNSTNSKTLIGISWEEGQNQFQECVKEMKEKYPHQTKATRIRIYSSISSTMTQDKPKQPSSVVLLTPPEIDSGFTPCLAREIGKKVHSVFHNITGMQYTQYILEIGPDYLQSAPSITDVHDKLKTYLNNGKVVIVNNVQQVNQKEHLMVFHAFCDNTAAHDKRATFLFIVPVPSTIYKKYKWEDENGAAISEEVLLSSWTSLTADKRPALFARVAANIIMIKPGDRCVNN